MDTLLQDLRYGVRMVFKKPGFTLIVLLTLALGIGANTAIFSVVNAVLLKPLAFPEPDRLLVVWQDQRARSGVEREWVSPDNFEDWRTQSTVFESMAAIIGWAPTLTDNGEPENLDGRAVTHEAFAVLGVDPLLGRTFSPEEDRAGAARVAVLSHGLWQRRFGGDPSVVGRAINLSGESYTVIGVMPPDFRMPFGQGAEIFAPARAVAARTFQCGRGCVVLRVFGRLKPGVSLEQAGAEMRAITGGLAERYPESNTGVGATLVGMQEQIVGDLRTPLLVLLGAVGFVLLIACANVANLMLARATAREREIAIRAALGAGRGRIVRQLVTESLLYAALGGALGLFAAYWLIDLLIAFSPEGSPRIDEIGIDGQVLLFTLAVALLTGLIFGIIPTWQVSRPGAADALKEGKGSGAPGRRARLRGALVAAEFALAFMLLVGAGLLIKSFANLVRVDPGFDPHNVLVADVNLPRLRYPQPAQAAAFFDQLMGRLRALPGVEAAGAVSSLPLGGGGTDMDFRVEGQPEPQSGREPVAWYAKVTPDYLPAMRMRLLRGRWFNERDTDKSPPVVVIAETLARRYWPNEDPVGKRLGIGSGERQRWLEIVGLVGDVKHFGLETEPRPTMYLPQAQAPERSLTVTLRTAGDPLALSAALREQVRALDPQLALSSVETMEAVMARSVAEPRFTLLLLTVFAGLALALAAIGIHGVTAYTVQQRTREIGVRMALGARRGDVLRLVLGQTAALALVGVGFGLVGAFAVTRYMESLLFGVSTTDPLTFALIPLALLGVALLACLAPARRATRVDPMEALRYE